MGINLHKSGGHLQITKNITLTTLSFTKQPLMNSKHALYTVETNLNSEFHFHFC